MGAVPVGSVLIICTSLITLGSTSSKAQGTPEELLAAWSEAYATMDGQRTSGLYTDDARLWGTASHLQNIGRDSITGYFSRARPGVTSISVSIEDHSVRPLAEGASVASGSYTFRMNKSDGTVQETAARFSMAMVRGTEGKWQIADHHSSPLPAPR
jgi:uncharacterized protein (TIGR02246 family)